MNPSARIAPDKPGHALIDVRPFARGCREVSLIADPLHFPPDLVRRITSTIAELLRSRFPAKQEQIGPWLQPLRPCATVFDGRFSSSLSGSKVRESQRILISLIMQSGRVRVELAFTDVDRRAFPPEEVDWLVAQLNDRLTPFQVAKRPVLCGQN